MMAVQSVLQRRSRRQVGILIRGILPAASTVISALLPTLGVFPGSLSAQEVVRFDDDPTCADGRPVILSESPLVFLDEEGRYYVGDRSSGEVFVYSAEGKFVGEFGREGEGPGEFKGFSGVIDLPGDTILAVDWRLPRLSIFGPDWEYVRSVRPEVPFARGLRIGDLFVVNPMRLFQQSGRSPIQAIDAEGKHVRGYGPPARETREDWLATLRTIAPYSTDAFMAAQTGRYRIEVWELEGNLRLVLERSIPEFPEPSAVDCSSPSWVPGRPSLIDIQTDGAGKLMVMLWMGDRKWRDGSEQIGGEGGCPMLRVTDRDLFRDTWIEVWDLSKGEVTTRTVYEEQFNGLIGPRLVGRVEYVADDVVYQVYRLETRGGSR
jgi:hypothetical protein